MCKRHLLVAAVAVHLASFASLSIAADNPPLQGVNRDKQTMAQAVETAQTQVDHEAIAKRFDKEAVELDKKIAEHEQLAINYHKGHGNLKWNTTQSSSASSVYATLATHCDNYVVSLKTSASEAREMAQLHRDLAISIAANRAK